MEPRTGSLVAWQWSLYSGNHTDHTNLVLHVLTVPIFMSGTVLLLAAPFTHAWLALVGLVMMALAVATQGRGHAREPVPPVPFSGPLDVAGRIFVEQWFTFPRYLLSGKLADAWRAGAPKRA
jgi:hypothetical protein